MKVLRDYSGEFLPEMRSERFPKSTLLDLLRLYARFCLAVDRFWYLSVKEKNGNKEALPATCGFGERTAFVI